MRKDEPLQEITRKLAETKISDKSTSTQASDDTDKENQPPTMPAQFDFVSMVKAFNVDS